MANTDFAFGFKPIKTVHGGPPRVTKYGFSGEATAIFPGDAVVLEADGYVAAIAGTPSTEEPILGIAANYVAASSDEGTDVYVYDDPDTIFIAQHDGTATQAMIGDALDITVAAGDATRLISQMEIDTSSSTTGQLQMLALYQAIDNVMGEFAIFECKIAKHHFTSALT